MALNLDDGRHYELEQLLAETIESLDGASGILLSVVEQAESSLLRAQLHAVRDVLVACRTRLDAAANMVDT